MTVDLRHNVISGFERGLPGLSSRAPTSRRSWRCPGSRTSRSASATCYDVGQRRALAARLARRAAARRSQRYAELGLAPVLAPELEFYLCEPDAARAERLPALRRQRQPALHRRLPRRPAGHAVDDARRGRWRSASARSRGAHEYGRSQYEINLSPRRGARRRRPRVPLQGRWSRSSPPATACSRPSWASRSTATRARGCTCTCRSPTATGANACADPTGEDGLVAARPPLHRRRDGARRRR